MNLKLPATTLKIVILNSWLFCKAYKDEKPLLVIEEKESLEFDRTGRHFYNHICLFYGNQSFKISKRYGESDSDFDNLSLLLYHLSWSWKTYGTGMSLAKELAIVKRRGKLLAKESATPKRRGRRPKVRTLEHP